MVIMKSLSATTQDLPENVGLFPNNSTGASKITFRKTAVPHGTPDLLLTLPLKVLINSKGKGFPSYPVHLCASDTVPLTDLQKLVSLWKASGVSSISRERRCRMWWDDGIDVKM